MGMGIGSQGQASFDSALGPVCASYSSSKMNLESFCYMYRQKETHMYSHFKSLVWKTFP